MERKKAMCRVCGEREAQDCGYGEYDREGDFDCTHEKAGELECPCVECICSVCKTKEETLYNEVRLMNFYEEEPHKRKHGQKSVNYFGKDCEHLCGAWDDYYQGNISKKKRPWPPIISQCNHPDVKKEKPCKEEFCPLNN